MELPLRKVKNVGLLKYLSVFLLCLVLITTKIYSQNSGFQGKHVLLKGDLIYPISQKGAEGIVEFILGRRFSMHVGYQHFTNVKDNHAHIGSLGLRLYLSSGYTAPIGRFFQFRFSGGTYSVKKNIFDLQNLPLIQFEIGYGVQKIYFRRLAVEFCLNVAALYLMSSNTNLTIQRYPVDFEYAQQNIQPHLIPVTSSASLGINFRCRVGLLLF